MRMATAALCLAFSGSVAFGQSYPSGTVTFVVPFPAGGTVDQVARAIGAELQELWGSAVVIENRPGAGNIVGATAVAQARPDGHTLLLGTTSISANPALFANLPYEQDDLAPVVFLAASPNVLMVQSSLGIDSFEDFLEAARDPGSQFSYGSVGRGSGHHICMEMLQLETGIELLHIPYAGVAPAVAAFMGGEVPVYCSDLTGALGLIEQGVAVPLGLTGENRMSVLPDVPTMAELGYEGMRTAGFIGVMTTGGTPDDVIAQLNADISSVVSEPELAARMSAIGYDMAPDTPSEFAAFIEANVEVYVDIVERAGIEVTQ